MLGEIRHYKNINVCTQSDKYSSGFTCSGLLGAAAIASLVILNYLNFTAFMESWGTK